MGAEFVKVQKKASSGEGSGDNLSHFLRIQDILGKKKVDLNLLEDLLISQDLDGEMNKIAVFYMFLSSLAASAAQRLENHKEKIKKYRAHLDDMAREGEILQRVTEAKVVAYIEKDPEMQAMRKTLNKYQHRLYVFESAVKAADIKARMLQTKSANVRRLMDVPEPQAPQRIARAKGNSNGQGQEEKARSNKGK